MRRMSATTFCFALLLSAAAAFGDLLPGQVVVIANRNDPASMRVADHYMQVRDIPGDHRVDVDLPVVTDISRAMYEQRVLEPVRAAMKQRGLESPIRCVVLSYGLPLRISEGSPSLDDRYEAAQLQSVAQQTLDELRKAVSAIHALGDGTDDPPLSADLPELTRQIGQAMIGATQRIGAVRDAGARAAMTQQLMRLRVAIFGPAGVVNDLGAMVKSADDRAKLATIRGQIESAELAIILLGNRGQLTARRERRRLQGKYFGLLGSYRDQLTDLAHYKRTDGASLDSELSLLWWTDYPLNDRLANVAGYSFELIGEQLNEPPVLIAARLQARSESTAMRMIDDAAAVERAGLRGKAFIDARGITTAGYEAYDQSLLKLAAVLRGAMQVTVDDKPEVMAGDSGEDAAIYCGWYALRNYNAPVKMVRGAVAYHIASFEATDFSDGSKEWAAGLLDDGAAVTIGAVSEPYLDAFPLPDDFYQLLMTGRYSVGEVYLMTSRYVSWQMTLIGDPMYNPYRARPAMTMAQVKLTLPIFGQVSDVVAAGAQRIVERAVGMPEGATADVPVR